MTGTPIENSTQDLVNLFEFIDPGRIPPETPAKLLPQLTAEVLLGEPGRATAGRFFEGAERRWVIGREGEVSVLRARA